MSFMQYMMVSEEASFEMADKIVVVKKASDFMDNSSKTFEFFADWRSNGFWHASTGQDFLPWLRDFGYDLLGYSDVLVVVAVILTLGIIAGSGRCRKWLWWCF